MTDNFNSQMPENSGFDRVPAAPMPVPPRFDTTAGSVSVASNTATSFDDIPAYARPGLNLSGSEQAGDQNGSALASVAPKTRKLSALLLAGALALGLVGGFGGSYLYSALDSFSRPVNLNSLSSEQAAPLVTSKGETPNWEAVAKTVENSVVAITVQAGNGMAEGSGVIYDAAGRVITNNHVVAGAQNILVTLSGGDMFKARVVGTDPSTDLAVLEIANPPKNLHPATFANSGDLLVGQPVAAIGNPLGLSHTMTTGIISALQRPVITVNRNATNPADATSVATLAIQVDASINPGNSGGPLFDAQGRVIGITSSIATTSEGAGSVGLGFAIPANLAQNIAKQLISQGTALHALLGVGSVNGLATANGTTRRGALLSQIYGNSPAQAAGLKEGDVIVKVDDYWVTSSTALAGWVRQYKPGTVVNITYVRDGKAYQTKATLTGQGDRI